MATNNCKSVSFEHPGCLHITLEDGSGLVVGSSGLDWYAADPDTGEWDLGAGPTYSIGFPNGEELVGFASPVAREWSEHTGGNVWIDCIELESGAVITVTNDNALACIWLFEA